MEVMWWLRCVCVWVTCTRAGVFLRAYVAKNDEKQKTGFFNIMTFMFGDHTCHNNFLNSLIHVSMTTFPPTLNETKNVTKKFLCLLLVVIGKCFDEKWACVCMVGDMVDGWCGV